MPAPRAAAVPHKSSVSVSEAQAQEVTSDREYRRYLLTLLAVPALFLLSCIPIVRSSTFLTDSGDPFLFNADYAFDLHHANCEVVVFGDSTALTGVDPVTVARLSGLSTCNISQSQSILEVVGPLALDAYLSHNTPPRYLILQFASETLAHQDVFWPEGLTLLLRRQSLPRALPFLLAHPVEFYGFALWAIKSKLAAMRGPPPDFGDMEATFRARHGLLVLPKPPQSACTAKRTYKAPADSWARQLRAKYAVNGTQVVIAAAPIPECDPHAASIIAGMRGIADNTVALYPIGLFNDLDRHLTLAGAERWSSELGIWVERMERRAH